MNIPTNSKMVVAFMAAVQLGYVSQYLRGISGGEGSQLQGVNSSLAHNWRRDTYF